MDTPTTLDLTKACRSFPAFDASSAIERPHFLDMIDSMFDSGIRCVVLEGLEGIGKTTLAMQYALRHANNAISLFIRVSNRWGYDPQILREDVASQLHLMLCGKDVTFDQQIDDALHEQLLLRLRRIQRNPNCRCVFVVDGLDEIPRQDPATRSAILDLLPLDFVQCRFLFTALDETQLVPTGKLQRKAYPLTGFSPDETRRLFAPLGVDASWVDEIHRTCRGVPGSLASVMRCLSSGQKPEELISKISGPVASILENEWQQLDGLTDSLRLALAVLALDNSPHSVAELAALVGEPSDALRESLAKTTFVTVDSCTSEVLFASSTMRNFAAGKLRSLHQRVTDILIDDLLKAPESDRAIEHLPERLRRAERYEDLLKYLSAEHVLNVVEHGGSLAVVRRQVEYGAEAAKRRDLSSDYLRFCMQQCALSENFSLDVCRSEIDARVAVGDDARALAIAASAPLKEDRLQLLAALARAQRVQGRGLEKELIDSIRSAYDQVEPKQLLTIADHLAGDLFFAVPELAISLLEKVMAAEVAQAARKGASLEISNPESVTEMEHLAALRARVSDPRLQGILSAAALFMGSLTADEARKEIELLKRPQDQIFFLRRWCTRNRRLPEAGALVEWGLQLAIQTTGYTPNARDIRQMVSPLPFLSDIHQAESIIRALDAQQGSFRKYGPTVDYVRLQLTIAEREYRTDRAVAVERLRTAYDYALSEPSDLSVRVECVGHVLSLLAKWAAEGDLEGAPSIAKDAESQFQQAVDELLEKTADHLSICRGILSSIAGSRLDLALRVADSLNLEARRDQARLAIVRGALSSAVERPPLALIPAVIDGIADPRVKSDAILEAVRLLASKDRSLPVSLSELMPFVDRAMHVRLPVDKCQVYTTAHNIVSRSAEGGSASLRKRLLDSLFDAWESVDALWQKVSTGFLIASELAKSAPEASRRFLEAAEQDKIQMMTRAPGATSSYMAALELTISSFSGLLKTRADVPGDLDRVAELVQQVPSLRQRVLFLADLAERFCVADRSDEAREIFAERIRPLLAALQARDVGSFCEAVIAVAPLLARVSLQSLHVELQPLSPPERDEAVFQACRFILRKTPTSQPVQFENHHAYDIGYDEAITLVTLMGMFESDTAFYMILAQVADSLSDRKTRNVMTAQQVTDIARRLQELAGTKLPSRTGISHRGYVIAARVQTARIRRDSPEVWSDLAKEVAAIPNLADRAFVYGILAEALASRNAGQSRQLFDASRQLIETIPATEDRAEHMFSLAQFCWSVDANQAKQLCRKALSLPAGESPGMAFVLREVVDFAHQKDPDFAASLIATLDDDPARKAERERLRARKEMLDTKQAMIDGSGAASKIGSKPLGCFIEAAELTLASLNSGRSQPKLPSELEDYLKVASSVSLAEAHPIVALAVGNAMRKYSVTHESATQHVRPVFEATMLACKVCARMTARASGLRPTAVLNATPSTGTTGSIFVGPNEREKGLQFLSRWLSDRADGYLTICDYYFGPSDLEVLKLVLASKPNLQVRVLTSKTSLKTEMDAPIDADYFSHVWRERFSEQTPPATEILAVAAPPKGDLPIHDRWWLTKGAGIAVGTSINSLGMNKVCRIDELTAEEAVGAEERVNRFLVNRIRDIEGQRVYYSLFTL